MAKVKNDDRRQMVFSTKVVEKLMEDTDLGRVLKRFENPWFKGIVGVRRSKLTFRWEQDELLEYARCKMDVHHFAEMYCKIKREDGTVGKVQLRDYQNDIIDLYTKNRYSILMASRQTGKCVTADTELVIRWNGEKPFNATIGELYYALVEVEDGLSDLQRLKFDALKDGRPEVLDLVEAREFVDLGEPRPDFLDKVKDIRFPKGLEVQTHEGFKPVEEVMYTRPYEVWEVMTDQGTLLKAADHHIVVRLADTGRESVNVDMLSVGDVLETKHGPEAVIRVGPTGETRAMFDLTVEGGYYYADGVLCHNTVSAAISLLHFVIFNNDKGVMIVANKGDTVIEIMDKIKKIYIELPFFLKVGVMNWGQKALAFENGSRIKSAARTKEPAIGFAIDWLYMDEFAHIPKTIVGPYYRAVVPTVSSIQNSRITITSTPNGYNLFHELVEGAMATKGDKKKNPYSFLRVLWHQVPGRRDNKLYLDEDMMRSVRVTAKDMTDVLESLGAVRHDNAKAAHKDGRWGYYFQMEEAMTGGMLVEALCVMWTEAMTIDEFRKLEVNGVSILDLGEVTNWEERETKLIGGKENFDQEYNLHFLAGSKRLFEPEVMDMINKDKHDFAWHDFAHLQKLWFETTELVWSTDPGLFDPATLRQQPVCMTVDLAEGNGGDDSVFNLFKIVPKKDSELDRTVIKDKYDCFKLEQFGRFSYNRFRIKEVAHLFYIVAFELLNPDLVTVGLEINGFGNEFLSELEKVFNGNSNYGSYIFAYFKHRADDVPRIGFKLGPHNKTMMVRDFQDGTKQRDVVLHEAATIEQINSFIKHETKTGFTFRAETGKDDLAITCVHANMMRETTNFKGLVDYVYDRLPQEEQLRISLALGESTYSEAFSTASLVRAAKRSMTKGLGGMLSPRRFNRR